MDSDFAYGLAVRASRNMQRTVNSYGEYIAQLEEQVRELTWALAVEQSNVAGLVAERDEMRKQNPNCQLLRTTSATFKDGKRKTFARLVFEGAFDKAAKEMGIEKPEEHRRD
jgi:hypothetical protein